MMELIMVASIKRPSFKQVLNMAACTCLMLAILAPHAGAEECSTSVDLTVNGAAIKGEATYEGGGQRCGCQGSVTGTLDGDVADITLEDDCRKTEVHKDSDEFRGRTTTINSDGSVNPQGEDTRAVLNKDQWRTDYKDGNYGQFGGEWPDDEYTRLIPRPDMPLVFAGINKKDNSFTAMFKKDPNSDSDIARMKNYVEKLKARGFTIDAYQSEKPEHRTYAFRAKNNAGYFVRANCNKAVCSLSLKKERK
ncbi:MAG: hypothetical protein FWD51_00345 [Betaproteobacteria bacterium]|nr:hypothetical protein [Betaproteobacteria bacterium]